MKQYIEVKESSDHHCDACGKRSNDESMEEKIMYDIKFIQDCENGNIRIQSIKLCWNCTKDLAKKMERARYESVCNKEREKL